MSKPNDYRPGNPEYDFWNDKNLYPSLRHEGDREPEPTPYDPLEPTNESSTLGTAIGGSIVLTLLGWFFAGLLLLLLWLVGLSGTFLFQLVFRIAFWGGIVFVVIMSILGVIASIVEFFSSSREK